VASGAATRTPFKLEAFSIFFGIKAMALLAIAVYGAAAFCYRGAARAASPEPAMVSQAAE
jgi:hypothetical protein